MGDEIDVTSPGDTDIIANYPPDERGDRLATRNLIVNEHYVGVANENKHKMGVHVNDAARDAVITTPQDGNFAFQKGSAAAANAPRMLAVSFRDGSDWLKGYFVPTGTILTAAYDPSTPPEGFLACDGAAVVQATFVDLFAVIGTAFDQQDGVAAPAGTDFRVPLLGGHGIVGLTAGKVGQPGWNQNISDQKDVFVTGTYSGSSRLFYLLEITATGTPDTFQWSDDAGATFTTGVSVAATNVLSNGLTLNWDATTGHSAGDTFVFVTEPGLAVVGATIGVSAYELEIPEMPAHSHTGTTDSTDIGIALTGGNAGGATPTGIAGANTHTHTFTTAIAGSNDAHENTPHVLVLGQMIKT